MVSTFEDSSCKEWKSFDMPAIATYQNLRTTDLGREGETASGLMIIRGIAVEWHAAIGKQNGTNQETIQGMDRFPTITR